MSKISQRRLLEWSFFLNHRNRITYNRLCQRCSRDCKQSFRTLVILCRRYRPNTHKEK